MMTSFSGVLFEAQQILIMATAKVFFVGFSFCFFLIFNENGIPGVFPGQIF